MAITTNINVRKAMKAHVENSDTGILTLETLQDKVLDGIQHRYEDNEEIRNFEETCQLLNFLFNYSIKQSQHDSSNAADVAASIAREISTDDLLLGYTHFICDSDTNTYNWSYMLENRNRFANFLNHFTSNIVWVVKDMNRLLSSINRDMTFLIDGYLELVTNRKEEQTIIEANINFDELYRIYSVNATGYMLTIKHNNIIQGVFWRELDSNLDKVINLINE